MILWQSAYIFQAVKSSWFNLLSAAITGVWQLQLFSYITVKLILISFDFESCKIYKVIFKLFQLLYHLVLGFLFLQRRIYKPYRIISSFLSPVTFSLSSLYHDVRIYFKIHFSHDTTSYTWYYFIYWLEYVCLIQQCLLSIFRATLLFPLKYLSKVITHKSLLNFSLWQWSCQSLSLVRGWGCLWMGQVSVFAKSFLFVMRHLVGIKITKLTHSLEWRR